MDILIKTADGSEVQRWVTPPGRVAIPSEKITVYPGEDTRPMAIGENHFLAVATIVTPDLGVNQKRGDEVMNVSGQAVTLTKAAVDMTASDIAARTALDLSNLRANRNTRLDSSDWTQASDTALSDGDKNKWIAYRSLLRDLPATDGFDAADVTWPTPPQ